MHVDDAPAPSSAAAHRHSVSSRMFFGGDNAVVVRIPERVPEKTNVVHFHAVLDRGSKPQIAFLQILHNLLSSAKFSDRRIKNHVRLKAVCQLLCFSEVERGV